jgi:hypothetical protein
MENPGITRSPHKMGWHFYVETPLLCYATHECDRSIRSGCLFIRRNEGKYQTAFEHHFI